MFNWNILEKYLTELKDIHIGSLAKQPQTTRKKNRED